MVSLPYNLIIKLLQKKVGTQTVFFQQNSIELTLHCSTCNCRTTRQDQYFLEGKFTTKSFVLKLEKEIRSWVSVPEKSRNRDFYYISVF
jgi:hypothetical protein